MSETRNIVCPATGEILGTVTKPDGTSEEEWVAVLSGYVKSDDPRSDAYVAATRVPSNEDRIAALEEQRAAIEIRLAAAEAEIIDIRADVPSDPVVPR